MVDVPVTCGRKNKWAAFPFPLTTWLLTSLLLVSLQHASDVLTSNTSCFRVPEHLCSQAFKGKRPFEERKANTQAAVMAIALGAAHAVAVTEDGGIFTWGAGGHGQLGM